MIATNLVELLTINWLSRLYINRCWFSVAVSWFSVGVKWVSTGVSWFSIGIGTYAL